MEFEDFDRDMKILLVILDGDLGRIFLKTIRLSLYVTTSLKLVRLEKKTKWLCPESPVLSLVVHQRLVMAIELKKVIEQIRESPLQGGIH